MTYIPHYDFFMKGDYTKLDIMLIALDECMRVYGHDEEKFKHQIGKFMWDVVQQNLPISTVDEDSPVFKHIGTFPKWSEEPGISHLLYEIMYYCEPHESKETLLSEESE